MVRCLPACCLCNFAAAADHDRMSARSTARSAALVSRPAQHTRDCAAVPMAGGRWRGTATRERIVRAASDQLAEGGYASAGVQAVAARAGMATGTVYRHFPSKSELFAEVFRRASARELAVMADTAAHEELPARERIAIGAETFARRALAEPTRAYALLAEPVDPAVEAERLTFRRAYRDLFAATIEQGIAG